MGGSVEVGEVLKLLGCSSFEEALARFRARTAHEAITRLVERGVVAYGGRLYLLRAEDASRLEGGDLVVQGRPVLYVVTRRKVRRIKGPAYYFGVI